MSSNFALIDGLKVLCDVPPKFLSRPFGWDLAYTDLTFEVGIVLTDEDIFN